MTEELLDLCTGVYKKYSKELKEIKAEANSIEELCFLNSECRIAI